MIDVCNDVSFGPIACWSLILRFAVGSLKIHCNESTMQCYNVIYICTC